MGTTTLPALGPVRSERNGGFRNRLLAGLPAGELELLAPHLDLHGTRLRETFYDPEAAIPYVAFVETGLASLLATMDDGTAVEAATVGAEGMVGMPVFHGMDRSSEQAMTQIAGTVRRIDTDVFVRLLPDLPALSARLNRYSAFLFSLAAQGSGCNRKHAISQRCARWLLVVADQVDSAELGLTHDFISQMLGVRRASVTETLAEFQRRGWIETRRGRILIVDREGLESESCGCFPVIRAAASRMVDGWGMDSPLAQLQASEDGQSILGDGTPQAASTDE